MAVSTSFVMYYGLAYGWHYYYYVSRRHLVWTRGSSQRRDAVFILLGALLKGGMLYL
jgi:hypothetical protein